MSERTGEATGAPAGRPAGARRVVPWVVLGLLVLAGVALSALELGPSAAWEAARANLDGWKAQAGRHCLSALVIFFAAYAALTTLPLPVVTCMSLLAGALFGRWLGTGVASLGYTAGVTAAFLLARSLLRERVRRRLGGRLARVERGLARDAGFYLLTLRLMPSVPYYLVNLLMALTPIRLRTYVLVSWAGVLPLTFLCAGVGAEVANLTSPSDVLSLPLLGSLAVLAILPLLTRKLLGWLVARRPGECGAAPAGGGMRRGLPGGFAWRGTRGGR